MLSETTRAELNEAATRTLYLIARGNPHYAGLWARRTARIGKCTQVELGLRYNLYQSRIAGRIPHSRFTGAPAL